MTRNRQARLDRQTGPRLIGRNADGTPTGDYLAGIARGIIVAHEGKRRVWVLSIEDDQGTIITAHASEESAWRGLRAYAVQTWGDAPDEQGRIAATVPDDDLAQFVADSVVFYLSDYEVES
jgi:hypothetical protein